MSNNNCQVCEGLGYFDYQGKSEQLLGRRDCPYCRPSTPSLKLPHTREPWGVYTAPVPTMDNQTCLIVIDPRKLEEGNPDIVPSICIISTEERISDEDVANAHLIAAAPELRDALSDLIRSYVSVMETGRDRILALGGDCDSLEMMESKDPFLKRAKAALAKAKGGQNG